MKKLLRNLFRTSALLVSTIIAFNLCVIKNVNAEDISTDVCETREKVESTLNKAIEWLINSQNNDGSWDNDLIINDTCRSIYSLGSNGYDTSLGMKWLNNIKESSNNDVLAHRLLADVSNEPYAMKLILTVAMVSKADLLPIRMIQHWYLMLLKILMIPIIMSILKK